MLPHTFTTMSAVTVLSILIFTTKLVNGVPVVREDLLSLESKLNAILESESKERELIRSIIQEDKRGVRVPMSEHSDSTRHDYTVKSDSNDSQKVAGTLVEESNVILRTLEANSERLNAMVMFFADMKSALSEALDAQKQQTDLRSQQDQLKQEVEYLRKEVLKLKERNPISSYDTQDAMSTKAENDKKTREWLKESVRELKSEMKDIYKSFNNTELVRMKQELEEEKRFKDITFKDIQKELKWIQIQEIQQNDNLLQAKHDIGDMRAWQFDMGKKVSSLEVSMMTSINDLETNDINTGFLSDELEKKARHKKLGISNHLKGMKTAVSNLRKDNHKVQKKLRKIENAQKILSSRMKAFMGDDSNTANIIKQAYGSRKLLLKDFHGDEISGDGNSESLLGRISTLEKAVGDYTFSLNKINEKVIGLNELHETTVQLFSTLENLEMKYDTRLNDVQTTLAKLEMTVSSTDLSSQDLQEKSAQQSKLMDRLSKDLQQIKDRLQRNQLRLSSLQSHMLQLSSAAGIDENTEAMQNIRIMLLQSAIKSLQEEN